MGLANLTFAVSTDRDAPERNYVRDEIRKCAIATTPQKHLLDATGSITIVARDADDCLVGGIFGDAFLGCLEVLVLWIKENYRRQGLGSKLLQQAEYHAKKLGCTLVRINTFDFQAPRFYQQHGYEKLTSLKYTPDGPEKIMFLKRI